MLPFKYPNWYSELGVPQNNLIGWAAAFHAETHLKYSHMDTEDNWVSPSY